MRQKAKQFEKRQGFTIIELLTVMSIIVILFGLLMPAMTLVKTYSKTVKERAQLHAIDAGLQMFHDDFGTYPPSYFEDNRENRYPGAMKLAEAMLGRDLLGFNPGSIFDAQGWNNAGENNKLYPTPFDPVNDANDVENLRSRKGPYIDVQRSNAYKLSAIYTGGQDSYVICDEFARIQPLGGGKRAGMPVLYYRANTSNYLHDRTKLPTDSTDQGNIYSSRDNQDIIDLPAPWDNKTVHPIATTPPAGQPGRAGFYDEIQNPKIITTPRPYNPDTFILMSAGVDGLYGTKDDIFNFEKE